MKFMIAFGQCCDLPQCDVTSPGWCWRLKRTLSEIHNCAFQWRFQLHSQSTLMVGPPLERGGGSLQISDGIPVRFQYHLGDVTPD